MATNFSPCKGSYVLNQFPSNVMFGMNGLYVSASGAIQGHHGPFVIFVRRGGMLFWLCPSFCPSVLPSVTNIFYHSHLKLCMVLWLEVTEFTSANYLFPVLRLTLFPDLTWSSTKFL